MLLFSVEGKDQPGGLIGLHGSNADRKREAYWKWSRKEKNVATKE